uniref:Uncharacterized protein n=1 Tax=Amblyomma maculatum TaxID=34609 RepID=G3MQ89_AMBMU
MSASTIVKILKERYVKHPRLEELDKAALVQLYEKTVLPLPQRDTRDTRTGRALAALRERADSRRKRKASTDASTDTPSAKQQRGPCSEPSTSRAREPPPNKSPDGKSASAETGRRLQERPQASGENGRKESTTKNERTSSADAAHRSNHSMPAAATKDHRQAQPSTSSSRQDNNASTSADDSDNWGSWDDEPKSKTDKTSTTNRSHGEGDGPPRKKHRVPITWP